MRRAARFLSMLAPLVAVVGFSKVHAAWIADPPYDYTGSFRFAWSFGLVSVLIVLVYAVGLPDVPRTTKQAAAAAAAASVGAGLAVSVVQTIVGDALLPRFVVLGSTVLLVPVQVVVWWISRAGSRRGQDRERVVLVAGEAEAEQLAIELAAGTERPALLVRSITPSAARGDGATVKPLVDLVLAEGANVVVVDRSALADDDVVEQAAALHEAGVRVRSLLQFYEEWLAKLPVTELERASLFFDISEVHRLRYGRMKRLVDIGLGILGLVPLLVVTPLVLAGNLIRNRGPLLYRQVRVGRGGETFEILKFRTMVEAPPGAATDWTAEDDPRITSFGRLLRTSHLDELPQVVNILRGELSVVGPRPEQPRYVTELSSSLPYYNLRHLVRPGLTGWAQVKYGYAGDQSDALQKLQYEFFYLRNQSLRFDLRVIGRTFRSVAGSEGRGR